MMSNSATHGFKKALATAAGDLTANFFQMLAAGLGLAALIAASSNALTIIKWLGVIYLLWLGVRMIRQANAGKGEDKGAKPSTTLKTLWLQGFLTSASNPKAVVFFAALFPQFIDPQADFIPQFIILSATYIIIDGCFLSAYGTGAEWVAKKFQGNAKQWVERIGGGFMVGAALLLGLKTIEE